MPTIAIVEDEDDLRDAVVEYLEGRGLSVIPAAGAAEFRAMAETRPFEVAVLDISIGNGEDGLSLARWLRGLSPRPGIILATAAIAPIDRIVGLELGADDYLGKPYELRELFARIKTVLRRVGMNGEAPKPIQPASAPQPAGIRCGSLKLDAASNRLTGPGGLAIELTTLEADLLGALIQRPQRVLSRTQLQNATGREPSEAGREIDIRVMRLRRKLRDSGLEHDFIRTVRGEGYMFVPDAP
jgi:two-component system phosphate regulon response regulator OmpR